MLSNGFETPLLLKRKPSRMLASYLLAVHGLAMIALLQGLAIPFAFHLALWLLWGVSIIYYTSRFWPRVQDTHAYWTWQASGDWICNDASTPTVMQLQNAVQTSWFILVSLRAANTSRHCLYFADQLDTDTWRRLRVRLGSAQAKETCSSGDCR